AVEDPAVHRKDALDGPPVAAVAVSLDQANYRVVSGLVSGMSGRGQHELKYVPAPGVRKYASRLFTIGQVATFGAERGGRGWGFG
ncbi:MAG: hypothetical protein M3220_01340, partial [Chloroflexota bacterium]|nr:hypothetical protein [Chloroflexota bacterium]